MLLEIYPLLSSKIQGCFLFIRFLNLCLVEEIFLLLNMLTVASEAKVALH